MMQNLTIYFLEQGISCGPHSLREKPLGGTESAMLYMAEALAHRNHEVHVFCEADYIGMHDSVHYHSWNEFETFANKRKPDVFVCVRNMIPLLIKRWAPLQIYFSPDAYDQPFVNQSMRIEFDQGQKKFEVGLYSLHYVKKYVDAIFCVGKWQAETFMQKFNIPRDKIFIANNGVSLSDIPFTNSISSRLKQIVYASTPFRGLEYLLKYFPKIRQKVPDATCVIMSGMQLYGMSDEDDKKNYEHLYKLANQPGVIFKGPLPKGEMFDVFNQSRLMTYPNTFAETFCISVLEAQACGLPVVTSALAGLKERVTDAYDGFLIQGLPQQESYEEQFIEKTIMLLKNDDLWLDFSQRSKAKAENYGYDRLALQWEEYFREQLSRDIELFAYPVIPQDETCDILLGGYPKRVHLRQSILMKSLADVMQVSGFHRSAQDLRQLAESLEKH